MKISKRACKIQPSLTRKLFNMASKYDNVIDLTLGDPDLISPMELRSAAFNSMNENKMHYSANAGLEDARKAISNHVREIWNVPCNHDENIIITVGGMEALYLSLLSIVDPGDEVIIFAPYYVNYVQMIEMCGGIPIIINAYDNKKGLYVNEKIINSSISDKTVAVIINSPNNPTGDIFSKEMLKKIVNISEQNDLLIISDEVYRTLTYDNVKHESILQFDDALSRTLLVDSLSKEYSMTGWRIGYAFGPKEIISNMVKLQENVAACAPVSSQYALIEAYDNHIKNQYIIDEFQKRRDYLYNELVNIKNMNPMLPKGTFYMFVNIKETSMNSEEFAYNLLENVQVAVVPGIAYGEMYDNYIRIAFTKDIETLKEAVIRIKKFLGLFKTNY